MLINKFLKIFNLTWVIRHRVDLSSGLNTLSHKKTYLLILNYLLQNEKILFQIKGDKYASSR
jgi:hypothetical protein